MEMIQHMQPEGSPLVALAQQRAEAANIIIVEKSVGNPRREPSVGNQSNNRPRRARSEAASLASGNHPLADNDVQHRITQNRNMQEIGGDPDDLHNVIEDRRHLKARFLTTPRWPLAGDDTPLGRGGFHALATPLRDVTWPDKFKAGHIDNYDGSNHLDEFIQIYHIIIEAAGGDDRVKANYLPAVLFGAARSWLINLPKESIYTWDQLCAMFIGNF
jgi:hypothetical protein